ncbi:reverse transcriptase [Senna tora]|uniref:Reverse transcriptase n=1 Tax=Senna tora TaxID=362788 RepID=A0A834WBL1_9FABA|nr:reverse transcriptase [Senna tora]
MGKAIVEAGRFKVVHSGRDTNFWHDNWCKIGPIRHLIHCPISLEESRITVAEASSHSNSWHNLAISVHLPDFILNHIHVVPLNPYCTKFDACAWVHNDIACNKTLADKNIPIDSSCPLCLSGDETPQHLFCDCSSTANVWQAGARRFKTKPSINFEEWLKLNDSCIDLSDTFNVPHVHMALARAAEFACLAFDLRPYIPKVFVELFWHPPPRGWFKLNVDGSCLGQDNAIAATGIFRDCNNYWFNGFAQFIGFGCSMKLELWSLLLGLNKAKELSIDLLEVESDCKTVVDFINCAIVLDVHPFAPLILMCRSYLSQFSHCIVKHIYREENNCCDRLAKHAASTKTSIFNIQAVPPFLHNVFWADLLGIRRSFRISKNSNHL